MPPADGSLSAPGQGPVRSVLGRLRRSYDAAPLPVKALILILCCVLCVPFAAVVTGQRSRAYLSGRGYDVAGSLSSALDVLARRPG